MKQIPETDNALVLRTDFSDDAAWESICAAIDEPAGEFGFRAHVDSLSDPAYDGITPGQVLPLIPEDSNHTFVFVVDRITVSHPEHPVLVIDLYDDPARSFRVVPSEMWGVENNLSVANMDFDEFAGAVDPDGVFRGFPES